MHTIENNPVVSFVANPLSSVVSAGSAVGSAVGKLFSPPKTPTLQSPNALSTTPSEAQASATASSQSLQDEAAAAPTSTILNGGAGLLDEPMTTSITLRGA
jgi:hypothetical protein